MFTARCSPERGYAMVSRLSVCDVGVVLNFGEKYITRKLAYREGLRYRVAKNLGLLQEDRPEIPGGGSSMDNGIARRTHVSLRQHSFLVLLANPQLFAHVKYSYSLLYCINRNYTILIQVYDYRIDGT